MPPVRVMIVDDSSDVRFLLRAIVEDAGGVVVAGEADGVRSALESIDAVDPDVVVVDHIMPVIGGLEAAPMILARRPGQKLILCSALVDDEVRGQAVAAGFAECVGKDEMEAIPAIALGLVRPA